MSARNYLYAREKNINKLIDCLPNINYQKFGYQAGSELPPLSANTNTSSYVNRNINYSFDLQSYDGDCVERTGTPFSDFFSESETVVRCVYSKGKLIVNPDYICLLFYSASGSSGVAYIIAWKKLYTPDFRSEESDSSSGSALRRNTAEATKTLAVEWERIERTLYDEDGEKSTRPQILEECRQWREIHPQLRIIGKAIPLPEKRLCYRQIEHDEVIAIHYSDYEQFSESEERLSQSSSDVTPQNSPRVSIIEDSFEPKLSREKVSFYPTYNEETGLPDTFCSLLQITPIQIRSPVQRKRQNTSILRSDIASSRWMRSSPPDSSVNCDRNSAKSFVSLDTRNYGNALSASDRNTLLNGRVVTARPRDLTRLEPLYTPEFQNDVSKMSNGISQQQYSIRKVSLPPLLLDEEKKKVSVGSAKKHSLRAKKNVTKGFYHNMDKLNRHN